MTSDLHIAMWALLHGNGIDCRNWSFEQMADYIEKHFPGTVSI